MSSMTAERLRELLHYNPDTGEFTWRVDGTGSVSAGSRAGYVRPNGRVGLNIEGRSYQQARLAWLYVHGDWPKDLLRPRNGKRSDCRIVNLCETPAEKAKDGTRECTICLEARPVTDFYRRRQSGHSLSTCKACTRQTSLLDWHRSVTPEVRQRRRLTSRRANLKFNYGLTWEQFSAMIAAQNGCCAICKNSIDFEAKKAYAVDHDHVSGKVRAILCATCNLGLGSFQDDPELLVKAANYLRLHRGGENVEPF